jgi:WD40 repeat protein
VKLSKPSKAHRLIVGFLFAIVTFMTISLGQIGGQSLDTLPFIALTNADLGNVYHLSWRPDGAVLAVASESGVWLFTSELVSIGQLGGHTDTVLSVDWNSAGTKLATGSSDSTVRIWDMVETSPTHLTTLQVLQVNKPISNVAWNPVDSKQELALSIIERTEFYSDGVTEYYSVEIWDVRQGILKRRLESDVPDLAYSVAWNPNGEALVTASLKMGQGYQINL